MRVKNASKLFTNEELDRMDKYFVKPPSFTFQSDINGDLIVEVAGAPVERYMKEAGETINMIVERLQRKAKTTKVSKVLTPTQQQIRDILG